MRSKYPISIPLSSSPTSTTSNTFNTSLSSYSIINTIQSIIYNLEDIIIRLFINYTYDIGCDIIYHSKVLILSSKHENSFTYSDSLSTIIRLGTILIHNNSLLHIKNRFYLQLLYHSIIICSSTLTQSKLHCINHICNEIENSINTCNILLILNNQSIILYEEKYIFYKSLHRNNDYLTQLSHRLVMISSTLLAIMISLAIIILLVTLSVIISPDILPYSLSSIIPQSILFNTLTSIKAIELSSTTMIIQSFIVLFIVLSGTISTIIHRLQIIYLNHCIKLSIENMMIGYKNSSKIEYEYKKPSIIPIIIRILILMIIVIGVVIVMVRGEVVQRVMRCIVSRFQS